MAAPLNTTDAQAPEPPPARSFDGTARAVIDEQLGLAERLSEELASAVLAHVDTTHRLTALLREALRDSRRHRAGTGDPQAPATSRAQARAAASDAVIDDLVSRLDLAILAFAAEAQKQDAIRQVIGGVAALTGNVIDAAGPPEGPDAAAALVTRLDWLCERFVMEEQRNAYAKSLGRMPAETSARLELF
jgi:hypothetical protein